MRNSVNEMRLTWPKAQGMANNEVPIIVFHMENLQTEKKLHFMIYRYTIIDLSVWSFRVYVLSYLLDLHSDNTTLLRLSRWLF